MRYPVSRNKSFAERLIHEIRVGEREAFQCRSFLASRDAKRTFGLRLSKISISTLQSVERTTHDDTATANFPDELPIMCTYCALPSINSNNVAN